jgi:hypothetical protein
MAKIVLAAALLRACDNYFFFGRYTEAAMSMAGDMLRWFGV